MIVIVQFDHSHPRGHPVGFNAVQIGGFLYTLTLDLCNTLVDNYGDILVSKLSSALYYLGRHYTINGVWLYYLGRYMNLNVGV